MGYIHCYCIWLHAKSICIESTKQRHGEQQIEKCSQWFERGVIQIKFPSTTRWILLSQPWGWISSQKQIEERNEKYSQTEQSKLCTAYIGIKYAHHHIDCIVRNSKPKWGSEMDIIHHNPWRERQSTTFSEWPCSWHQAQHPLPMKSRRTSRQTTAMKNSPQCNAMDSG